MKSKVASMKLGIKHAFGILLILSSSVWGGKIVYPWNATTAIVKVGNGFDIWFDADKDQHVTSVVLQGPFNSVPISGSEVKTGAWVYDTISSNSYNTRITFTVPAGTPADRYDLILNTSTGDEVSRRSVKVISEYEPAYSIMHISDTHMCQGAKINGHPERLFKIDALAKLANIIGPEMVFATGDLINNNMFPPAKRSEFFYDGYEEQGMKGMHGFDAATFSTVGNHDFLEGQQPGGRMFKEKAQFWNEFHGLQDHHFSYGDTRCMTVNTGWNGFDWRYQLNDHASWLKEVGSGNLRIAAFHKSEMGIMGEWAGKVDLGLAVIGHNHHLAFDNPYELGGRSILYYADSAREHMVINLFRVAADYTYTAINNAEIMENPEDPPAKWRPNLSLEYATPNDGTTAKNSATLVNKFEVGFPRARVRFVMPKGKIYTVSNGTIEQAFDGDSFHIVDVRVSLEANSAASVKIESNNP